MFSYDNTSDQGWKWIKRSSSMERCHFPSPFPSFIFPFFRFPLFSLSPFPVPQSHPYLATKYERARETDIEMSSLAIPDGAEATNSFSTF